MSLELSTSVPSFIVLNYRDWNLLLNTVTLNSCCYNKMWQSLSIKPGNPIAPRAMAAVITKYHLCLCTTEKGLNDPKGELRGTHQALRSGGFWGKVEA